MSGAGNLVPMLGDVPHPPPGLPMPQYPIGDYIGQHPWPANITLSANITVSPMNQPIEVSKTCFFLANCSHFAKI